MTWALPSRGPGTRALIEPEERTTRERIPDANRMRSVAEFARMRAEGRAIRGTHCLVVVARETDAPIRIAFVASRRGVGGAVQRNRARRRLREIVRRRWPRMTQRGTWLMFVAFRSVLTAPHADLALDVERLLARAGVLADRLES